MHSFYFHLQYLMSVASVHWSRIYIDRILRKHLWILPENRLKVQSILRNWISIWKPSFSPSHQIHRPHVHYWLFSATASMNVISKRSIIFAGGGAASNSSYSNPTLSWFSKALKTAHTPRLRLILIEVHKTEWCW